MTREPASLYRTSLIASAIAVALGLCVPLQMVSQTWDDHDRSGRYAARDFAINYLESLEPNAIVFCNGDNDTFPLWYVQEVEGVRPDVRIINLSYLNSDWYANQHRMQAYDAAPAPFTSKPEDIAYGKSDIALIPYDSSEADLLQSLKALFAYEGIDPMTGYPKLASSVVTIPIDKKVMVERGLVAPQDTAEIVDKIRIDLSGTSAGQRGYLTLGEILMLDIIATNAAEGWPRPIYWASTVGDQYYLGFSPYMRSTGMTYQLVPTMQDGKPARTDRAYDVVTRKYLWGTRPEDGMASPYFDETARRMLFGVRNSMAEVAKMLYTEGLRFKEEGNTAKAREAFTKALEVVNLIDGKMSDKVSYYDLSISLDLGDLFCALGGELSDKKASERGLDILKKALEDYARPMQYRSEVMIRFVNPSLSHEMTYLPYYYYQVAEAYLDYGGKREFVDNLLASSGWNFDTLRQAYEQVGRGGGNDYDGRYNLENLALEIMELCDEVAMLQDMDPEEYARQSRDVLLADSVLEYYIQEYLSAGGDEALLQSSDAYRRLDRKRLLRLYNEFAAAHGE